MSPEIIVVVLFHKEIAKITQVGVPTVNRYPLFLRQQPKTNIKRYIDGYNSFRRI